MTRKIQTLWPCMSPMALFTVTVWVHPEVLHMHGFQWKHEALPGPFLPLFFQGDITGSIRKKQPKVEEMGLRLCLGASLLHTL